MLFLLATVLMTVAADDCPLLFLRYSSNHSYCQPPQPIKTCDIVAYYLGKEDIDKIMNMHNSYRSFVATGREGLPTATNMLEMEWDDELAAVAQKYADKCAYKHDCNDCRRVMNFGVGQNIAIQTLTGAHLVPQPDWSFALTEWFSEIIYFNQNNISPFNPPNSGGEFRHFSQLVWAETYRVGCGYVLYKQGQVTGNLATTDLTYVRLYFCNYGPNGNNYGTCVYEQGPVASNCPENTAYSQEYSGLCKRIGNPAPYYTLKMPHFFHCDFTNQAPCENYVEGLNKWVIQSTLSGNFVSITLNGGESSTLGLTESVKPANQNVNQAFCVTLRYRKGPNMAGDEDISEAYEIFYIPSSDFTFKSPLPGYGTSQFATYNMTLNWGDETQVKFSFSVPSGKPTQYFEVKEIFASNGECSS